MFTEEELKALDKEYFDNCDKIRELENRNIQIDILINNNSKEKVASKFIPLEFGDKIMVASRCYVGKDGYRYDSTEGFFGSWVLDGHQYTVDNGEHKVKLRLYQIKKDGTRSLKYDEFYASNIVNIVKKED